MRALIAFDKFKDALSAGQACEITAQVLREKYPQWSLDLCPLADGGEGFAEILTASVGGEWQKRTVVGPRGKSVDAGYGIVDAGKIPAAAAAMFGGGRADGRVAVIEMAAASGLAMLAHDERDPWQTTTLGTGELMHAAADAGVNAILLGVGGSATNDLGLGALAALGFKFHDSNGREISPPIPETWSNVARISGKISRPLPPVFIACDVTNPLLGPRGAAAVFGPQKGLKPADRPRMEHESARLALMLCQLCGKSDTLMETPGAGAAGGISFGLMVAHGAKLLPGADLVSAWLDLDRRLGEASVVVTGEGRFDESSLHGKGPGAVVARALAAGLPVHVFAGDARVDHARPGLSLHSITEPGTPLPVALRAAAENLAATVRRKM